MPADPFPDARRPGPDARRPSIDWGKEGGGDLLSNNPPGGKTKEEKETKVDLQLFDSSGNSFHVMKLLV